MLKRAWQSIGKNSLDRDGIDGEHRHLSIVSVVAQIMALKQASFITEAIATASRLGHIPFYQRFYDCSPNRMRFGALQDQLYKSARYAVKDPDRQERWKIVNYEGYQKTTKRRGPARAGILELMAQSNTCHFVAPDGTYDGVKNFSKPAILECGNASCLYSATEAAHPSFAFKGIKEACSLVPLAFVSERPDSAAVCKRKKAKSSSMYRTIPNLFEIAGQPPVYA